MIVLICFRPLLIHINVELPPPQSSNRLLHSSERPYITETYCRHIDED